MAKQHVMTHRKMSRILITIEFIGFFLVILFLWLDEFLDLPRLLFHGPATPANFTESLLETVFVVTLGALVIYWTRVLLAKIRHLEGFYRVCASCHKVWTGRKWLQFESWVSEESEAEFTHGLCQECKVKFQQELKEMT